MRHLTLAKRFTSRYPRAMHRRQQLVDRAIDTAGYAFAAFFVIPIIVVALVGAAALLGLVEL